MLKKELEKRRQMQTMQEERKELEENKKDTDKPEKSIKSKDALDR